MTQSAFDPHDSSYMCVCAHRQTEGDIGTVDAPGGTRVYEILGVRYA